MPPTPPSPDDDILDLDGLDMKPSGAKTKAPESDFEKELEALFAEELASSDEKPASAPPVGGPELEPEPIPAPAPEPAPEEDVLLLEDLVADAPAPEAADADDEVLDLGDFAAGEALDITPPEETPGGKDGNIDLGALDELISGLGEKMAAPTPEPEPADRPHDDTDMAELLETLDVPKAAAQKAPPAQPEDEMLELTLGDLVEDVPQAAPLAAAGAVSAVPEAELPDLDLTLPDISDPEPGRNLLEQDLGGELNLSLTDLVEEAPGTDMDQLPGSGVLDMTGMEEAAPAEEPAPEPVEERSLDARDLLEQIADIPAEPVPPQAPPAPAAPAAPEIPLADADLAAVLVQPAVSAAPAVAPVADEALREQVVLASRVLAELQERFAALTTQVTGGSVAVVRLEGRLAEKDQAVAELEGRLQTSQTEAQDLRGELSALRAQLEDTLRTRVQDAEKEATALKERLALVEDRQSQLDREVHTEIARAVPREAAKVIREEIAHLAASMREE